ncbi:hypothetical protein EDB81DRAFT_784296 [Dactylonectria macrodidyma]|uniref:MFS maltose permease n=1 Tax=Dactylonectria macrodidyma TaxID=307937 RepID=A0A9P9FG81_9HYPO|nr:hypothetical protein EDB81DRAFT_784296 [Dactylonectria macrodidyma]
MRPRLVGRRARLIKPRQALQSRTPCLRTFTYYTQLTTKSRPILPFLAIPVTNHSVRCFTTERRQWLKHEAKMAVRYTASFWGILVCMGVIYFFINEESLERDFPTPHEWSFITRKLLRDANTGKDPKDGEVNWAKAMELSRGCVLRLEDAKVDGAGVTKLSDVVDPSAQFPGEFNPCDISSKSEEWRRGYFEAIMLGAKASEHTDGWVRDLTRNVISPPEFVIGPSNPRPVPIPPGQPHAPREEDCEVAYPGADNWYMKILATKGFTARQKLEAALEYASFMEYKQRPEGPDALYNLALAEATQGLDMSNPPYNPKTFVLNEKTGPPSLNLLDAITAIATHKARSGDISGALPIYLSLLKARRFLSNNPPSTTSRKPRASESLWSQAVSAVSQADYPPPPPDGTQPPWRSPQERCQEASLSLWIGEILYASSSRDDGLSWTRDSVDTAEEQLRALGPTAEDKASRTTCRECLSAGLDNWGKMVVKLAKEETAVREKAANRSSVFSFWSGAQSTEGRWSAEDAVVKERVRRTKELLEDVKKTDPGLASLFQA